MFGTDGWRRQERRSRARDRAAWLIRDHGDAAEEVLARDLLRPGLSAGERRRMRLTRAALRKARRQPAAIDRGAWKPALFSIAGIAALLGIRLGRRRRSGRRRS